jgi:hypothetical protein
MWLVPLLVLLLAVVSDPVSASFVPVPQPRLEISPVPGQIHIDGILDDSGWQDAARVGQFVERYPGDQTKPPVETEVYAAFDEERLYVAFVCHDDPVTIRATYCERDKIQNDDNVRLCLDTYGNASHAYIFYVNPYGIQGDAIWVNGAGEESSYDLIWESSGLVTDSGYQVEMAIPFATLRFPQDEQQSWRVDFWRNHPRETQAEYAWTAYDRDENCWPCQWGTVTGIAGVQPGRGIEIAPAFVAFRAGQLSGEGDSESPYRFDYDDPEGELSLWSKYTVSSTTTVEATVNPDFSQIESDAGQIDVNTTYALYYPEQRPFFQEGSDLFRAAIFSVYTRSINDPEFAVKATVRGRKTSVGFLAARDRNSPYILPGREGSNLVLAGKSTSNILRVKHSVSEGSYLGLIATDQRFDDGGGAFALTQDGRFRLSPTVRANYHIMASHTRELDDTTLTAQISNPEELMNDRYTRAFDGESYWGYFLLGNLRWWTSTWNASLQFQESNPTVRQPNGLFRQTSYRYIGSVIGYFHRLPAGLFETINPHVNLETEWFYDGQPHYKAVKLNLWTRLRYAQASFYSTYYRGNEFFSGRQYDNIWHLYQDGSVQLGDILQLTGSVKYGHEIARRYVCLGKNLDASLEATLKPHDRLIFDQSLNYARSRSVNTGEELYEGYIYRSRLNYQVSTPFTARLVVEYSDFEDRLSVDPLLTYRVNAFSVLYVGMTSNYKKMSDLDPDGGSTESNRLESRQIFAKLQYLFQI